MCRHGGRPVPYGAGRPQDICKSVLSGGRCISVLRLPVFDTTPPGMGGRLKPRCARHGNFTPPRIAPSCPQAGISLCTDEVMAKTACPLFLDGWVPLAALFGLFYGESPQAGLGAPSRVASRLSGASSGNVFQSPDVTGLGPVFFKVRRGSEQPPHYLAEFKGWLSGKIFNFLKNISASAESVVCDH